MLTPAKASEPSTQGLKTLGIVGAGQLARMLIEAASPLDLQIVVLAQADGEPATLGASRTIVGLASDPKAMAALAEACDVITFDHELVDLEILSRLEAEGTAIRPAPSALRYACNKADMRVKLSEADIACPRFLVLEPGQDFSLAEDFASMVGLALVVKAATGGYDGRGVFMPESLDELRQIIDELHQESITVLLEERVVIRRELAALVVRGIDGSLVTWPTVETVQIDGMCQQVEAPGDLPEAIHEQASRIAAELAHSLGLVGVMAVELFETEDGLLVNELAMRPHNTGHWTIEGAVTSQFENHLRAVLGLSLGSSEMTAAAVAMVNLLGPEDGSEPRDRLHEALAVKGAHLHLYGKAARPGRKLGHVTTLGSERHEVLERAWQASTALGTQRKRAQP
ncbi:MAG: 5-(carboxyamino)imidazole ribonucleotide synthase [Actinomycetes bacterium]